MTHTLFCYHNRNFRRILFFAACSFFFSCNFDTQHKQQIGPQVYASLQDSTFYVGMNTCRQCHPAIYDSYVQTGMGQSFDKASHQKSAAHFDVNSGVMDSVNGYRYHPYWQNDTLFVLEYLLRGKDTTYRRKEKVDYIVGSGQHTNSHIRNVNGYLYQVPVTYYTQESRWDLPPGFEGGFNSRFSRKIELECMSCHNAMPKLVPGSENKYVEVPAGIDCERCHGPGSKHLADINAGIKVDTSTAIDYSIVNPSKLPISLQLDVCQRCHIQGNAVLNDGKSFADFKPGMKLSTVMNVFMPVYKGDPDAHIMASHAERLKMSKCYIFSLARVDLASSTKTLRPYKDALTCITCHNPHVSVKHTGTDVFNRACKGCHSAESVSTSNPRHALKSEGVCSASEAERKSKGDNCVACHMPKSGAIDIPHVVTTDHFIRKPIPARNVEKIREFIGLVCINNADVDSITRGKAFISYYEKFTSNPAFLDSAKRYVSDGNSREVREHFKTLVHWAFLKNDFLRIIQYTDVAVGSDGFKGKVSSDNTDAWTCYRIGQAFMREGDLSKSLLYFARSVELAPYQPDFRNKLASAQHDARQVKEAKENFRFLLRENPDYVPAYTNYGYLLLAEDRDVRGAEDMYNHALALDPINEQALLNKAGLLVYQQKFSMAESMLKYFLKKYPKNSQALKLYQQIKQLKQ